MKKLRISTAKAAIIFFVIGAFALVGTAIFLMPSALDLAAAKRRAMMVFGSPPSPASQASLVQVRTPEALAKIFASGAPLSPEELKHLLADFASHANAETLLAIVTKIETSEPVSTERVAWEILNSKRDLVARDFLELRADRSSPALWNLRFELHRKTGNIAFAQEMVRSAAATPGAAKPQELIAAAYAVSQPELIVRAAERGIIPPMDRALSLDMSRWAASHQRTDLIARIDNAGTSTWRNDDPWLAMDLAKQAGDFVAASRYAAMLPAGTAGLQQSSVNMPVDPRLLRAMLLKQAPYSKGKATIAEQLLATGFRSDAIAVLQSDSTNRTPGDPVARRLLYLMGPRPDAQSLRWLREMAGKSPEWQSIYVDREKPSEALAFNAQLPEAGTTESLLRQLRLASSARDRQAGKSLAAQLLDGRELSAAAVSEIAANAPPNLDGGLALALSRARSAANAALPQDLLDLAWDSWKRNRTEEAFEHLQTYLVEFPRDRAALGLMADVEAKRRGTGAARVWLEQALTVAQPNSLDRAKILERLSRHREAMQIVEVLHQAKPADRHVAATYGRLLVATGNPGLARKVLQP